MHAYFAEFRLMLEYERSQNKQATMNEWLATICKLIGTMK